MYLTLTQYNTKTVFMAQTNLIELIPWTKEWSELSSHEKGCFLCLTDHKFLSKEVEPDIIKEYIRMQIIIEERGIENIIPYLLEDDMSPEMQSDMIDLENY